MFCRNCGKELLGTPEICPDCGARPLAGNSFCQNCGAAITPLTEICMKCGARIVTAPTAKAEVVAAEDISPKSRLTTTLLAAFLGTFGAHRFYLGKIGTAIGMLILTILYFSTVWFWGIGFIFGIAVWIWVVIDFIFTVSGKMRDKEGKLIKNW